VCVLILFKLIHCNYEFVYLYLQKRKLRSTRGSEKAQKLMKMKMLVQVMSLTGRKNVKKKMKPIEKKRLLRPSEIYLNTGFVFADFSCN